MTVVIVEVVSILELNSLTKVIDVIMNFMALQILADIDTIFITAFLSPKWSGLTELEIPIDTFKSDKYIIPNEFVILKSDFDKSIQPYVVVEEEATKDDLLRTSLSEPVKLKPASD